jgi:vacuolar-type H+-ATPase subunit I/STV1
MPIFQQFKLVLVASSLLLPLATFAGQVEQAINTQQNIEVTSQQSQKKIDALDDETNELLVEYRNILNQTESLKAYNAQLDTLIDSQQQELSSIDQQLANIAATQRDILPLMTKMIETLSVFIELDFPFLMDERQTRVASLQELMKRADISLSEKYRRILEAYQVETEYGRTIEAYQAELVEGEGVRTVDFLRIGRIGLYYLSLDGAEAGMWDSVNKQWQILPSDQNQAISQGLKVALKQLPPDLLVLPVQAAEVSQ